MATYSTGLPAQYKGTATLYEDLLGQSSGLLDYFGGLKGTSTGLSPEVLAGLNTQALETIPNDFRTIESDLTTSLARRGGGLPMGGEFLRTYAPLQAAKEQQKSSLLRDTLLADQAERRRTGDLNNANALAAAGQAGSLGANLLGQATQAGQFSSNQQFTGEQNEANRQLQLKLAEIENAPASMKSMLMASLISTGIGGPNGLLNALLKGGGTDGTGTSGLIGDLGRVLGIGGPAAAAIPGAAAVPGVAAGGGGAAAGGGLLSALLPLAPLAAAAIPAYFTIKNAQVHPTADKWVQGAQNPFDDAMKQTQDPAQKMELAKGYLAKLQDFAQKGGNKEAIVANQALDTFTKYYGAPQNYGVNITLPKPKQIFAGNA